MIVDGYVYRFDHSDGRDEHAPQGANSLADAEGAFLLCGFVAALAEAQQGNMSAAFRLFERNRSASGTPGLLAEEFDVRQRQLRGNLPQAFVHALLLETATILPD